MINDVRDDAQTRMNKSIESYKTELQKIRTGRAHASLLDHVMVEFYGSDVPISQAANISVEDARTLAITVWDASMAKAVEKVKGTIFIPSSSSCCCSKSCASYGPKKGFPSLSLPGLA